MNGNNGLNAWIAYKLFVPLHSNAGFLTCNKLFFYVILLWDHV